MSFDIVVIGAGPAGLCFARTLAGSGLRVALVERQSEAQLATPPDDGREIAITHYSQRLLRELGLWGELRAEEIGTLRDAKVLDGNDQRGLLFHHEEAGAAQLGWLVGNHAIRRAAFAQASAASDVTLLADTQVTAVQTTAAGAEVSLANGETLHAKLVVAADSRFSETRRAMGIGAETRDFGKTMLVLRMHHDIAHEQVAWEWFAHGQTLALLPLHDAHTSSAVLTLPPAEMREVLALDDAALGAAMAARFQHRLGAMEVAGPRCAYPLVGVYANRFVAQRFALIGDAAVGMHPVTAHGFNFGLLGQYTLASALHRAANRGGDIASAWLLRGYEHRHRLATRPLYLATNLLAGLYTDDRRATRLVRKLALGAGVRVTPFKRMVMAGLTADRGGIPLPSPLRLLQAR
ncbi:MAG: FAD-dependent hydroxylase [Rhodanobacter sp.]|nr:MAG: FAD-dependent hydroxylase [Rhodanobacter sp.]TAM13439.1 MAG: FAD-dependent hydroxylase [Rhodanobacter sp.]TAM35808.1 MAG: FAD-dependent hydroxylase [Rhodanobacter sp.]